MIDDGVAFMVPVSGCCIKVRLTVPILVMISSLSWEDNVLCEMNLAMSMLKRAITELVATRGSASGSG
jgi:hypothetical protein